MMRADVSRGAQASMALAKYQCFVLAPETVASLTRLPPPIHEVVRLPGWPVMLLPDWPVRKYRETVTMASAGTAKSIGSV